jgi:branched-chain amino acid transport system substrate-binding protein
MLVQHVKKKGSLKGKKIALVYHDSPYGKEPIKLLEERAKMEGFHLILLPVTHPGVEQKATWLQVRQQRPDYVFLWGWGVMNSTSIKEAIAVSYPRLQMYGVWWSSAEPDVTPAEDAAKGYNGIALGILGARLPRAQGHDQVPLRQGQGHRGKQERGRRRALQPGHDFRDAVGRGDQGRAGQVRQAPRHRRGSAMGRREPEPRRRRRSRRSAFGDMVQPLKTSCSDHGGVHRGRVHTWDGKQWSYTSDWYEADQKVIRPLVNASAKAYAGEKKLPVIPCAKAG